VISAWTRLGRFFDRLGGFLIATSAVMLLLMVVLMGTEIGARALLKTSTQIADEYSGYLFTWITLCSFLYAQRTDRFLRVDSLRSHVSPRARAGMDCVASLLAGVLSAILLYATWSTFLASVTFGTLSIQPSQTALYLPQFVMPAGFVLLLAAFLHSSVTSLLQALGRLPIAAIAEPQATSYE
jgi:TRAP-type C4-dicarboxylate transport system permease small subunit